MNNEQRQALEKKIVRGTIRRLKEAGFLATQVWDGGEYVKVRTEEEVLEAVFSVDDSTVHFDGGKGENKHSHGVLFILGNGCDVISDYHCGDPEFDAAMDQVNAWVNGLEQVAS